jgi:hypothetical protein
MKETLLSKRRVTPSRGPPSPLVASAHPWPTRSEKCTSGATSQGALVHRDTLKNTREIQKYHNIDEPPRENLKSFIKKYIYFSIKHYIFIHEKEREKKRNKIKVKLNNPHGHQTRLSFFVGILTV